MDENQDKIVFNELKPFDKQVDDVLSGADTTSSHLEVLKVTPPLLRMVGVPNLPILMTAYHVKTITQENGSGSANYHGLNVDVVKKLPELLSDPVMIMDSLTRDDSIVVVTQTVDKENRPVIGAIKLGGKGYLNSIEIDANILSSAYGRESFQSFIERNIAQGKVLYVDKEKSQELAKIPGIQFPDNFATLDFDTIIRKTNAFVNRTKENNSKNTEKSEENMTADTKNATAQAARERVQQVRDDMVKTLLEHIEKNPTDWQSGWNNIAAGAPYNGKTNTAYRGMNALYLAFLGAARGYKDTRWVTFNQAKELGASVKKGEKSSPVIFFEFYDRATKKAFSSLTVKDMTDEEKTAYMKENVYAVMKYSSVFNAEQCHNFPERKEIAMSEEERAKQNIKIEAIIANSSAPIRYDGGSRAYYSPGTDSIHLPVIQAFDTMQDYYATALHEIAHSTGHEKRLNRDLSGGFGSESYAKEELRAELACVFMQMEQGIQLNGKHITNHAAYLNSWLEAAKKDTSVFFKAAADAQKIADYVADNYLQAVSGDVHDESAVAKAENTSEEVPERNPMADYLRAEQLDRSVGIDAGQRAWEQENIRDWYTSEYPNDEAGLDIHPNATFKDLQEEVNRPNPISVYGMLGEDSVVRERTFTRLAELSGSSYASIYSAFIGETAQQKLDNARAMAKRLATETGEPYVTIEWSEHQALNSYDVMSLSEADKKLAALDAQEDKNDGYYKTKLHIDYVFEGKPDAYENCRFDIGSEGGGLVYHIDGFLKNDTLLGDMERQEAEAALEYFKRHMEVSEYLASPEKLANFSEEEQGDVNMYVSRARDVLNNTEPFSDYYNHMPLTPEEIKKGREAAHSAGLPFYEGNDEDFEAFEAAGGYVYDGNMSVEDYQRMWELREQDEANTEPHYLRETRYGSPVSGIAEVPVGSGKFVAIIDNSEQKEDAFPDQYPPSFIIAHDYNPHSGEWQTGVFGFSHYEEARSYYLEQYGVDIGQSYKVGEHEEKLTLEEARNAMLDAQEQRQKYYAVRIENVPYTDPDDGYESEEPAQVIYTVSQTGRIEQYKTIQLDSDVFSSDLPYGGLISYEPVEYEELEEIARKVREPIQTYKDVLRAELDAGTDRRRSEAYYDQRVEDILDEHYRTEYGLFERNIENPKYLSGTLYADETWRGERIESLTQDENGRNIAIIARNNGTYSVAEDYHTDDGRRWGAVNTFENLKAAEAFRIKNFPTDAEKSAADNYKNLSASKSPLGQEYARIKNEHPDSVVFYRVGDFYEVLGADAERVAGKLELTLTGRTIGTAERVPMCGVPFHAIEQYTNILANRGENVVIADGSDVKTIKSNNGEHEEKIDLTEKRLKNYADILRRNDLEVGNTAKTDEQYINQAKAEIAAYEQSDEYKRAVREDFPNDFIDDRTQDMAEIAQNKPVEAQGQKREWLSIELPNGAVGGQYGDRAMIKMPQGEFAHYAFYVPNKLIKEKDGKSQLLVASDYTYRLQNDGKQIEVNGRELRDSFAGKRIDKTYRRGAPSRKFAQGLANIEKNVPAELKDIPTWCCYRTRWNDEKGKKDKFIISPIDGKWASSKEIDRWTSFDKAIKYARENNCEGLSVLLDKKYGITCIDLDKCVLNAETGELNERATKLTQTLNGTYIERSTSGNGLHIFVKDDILKNGQYNMQSIDKAKGDLEVYDDKRIMSLTGDMYSKTNTLTRAGSAATVYLRQELGERRSSANGSAKPKATGNLNLSDSELVRWIQGSKAGSQFNDLYSGRGISGDRSLDDAKMANILLYFSGGDEEQTFRIMRESGLNRQDKPDSYYRHTIGKINSGINSYAKRPNLTAGGAVKPSGRKGNGNQA